jgi:3-carboxy-cis,cis-muconate cycloisomerase
MPEQNNPLFTTPAMAAAFSSEAFIRAMLDFEAALARAEARAGVIPAAAAQSITAACKTELFEANAIFAEAASAGTPAIPLVKMLTARVEGEGQKFVHWGATSQDVIDTALMLQMQTGLRLLEDDLLEIGAACAELARQHRHTLMAGRTLLQQALPITFGLKAARWLGLATRQVIALRERRERSLAIQLGGAAGTLAALGDKGLEVAGYLAEELGLPAPDLPWHTERDRIADIAASLGITAGAMAKLARDLVLLAQTELGEATEGAGAGKGGSSAMPQKRNPVDATLALAAARLAVGVVPVILAGMEQEHERAVGGWQAEWAALPELFRYTAKAVAGVRHALAGLEVDPQRMQANLNLTHGLVMAEALTMALAPKIGRPEAFKLVETLSKQVGASGQELREVAKQNEQVRAALSPEELEQALDPAQYLGSAMAFIDRALTAYQKL